MLQLISQYHSNMGNNQTVTLRFDLVGSNSRCLYVIENSTSSAKRPTVYQNFNKVGGTSAFTLLNQKQLILCTTNRVSVVVCVSQSDYKQRFQSPAPSIARGGLLVSHRGVKRNCQFTHYDKHLEKF